MGFAHLKVRTRIFVGFGLLVVLSAGLAIFTLVQLGAIGTQVGRLPVLQANLARVMDTAHGLETMRRAITRYRLDRNDLGDLRAARGRIEQLLNEADRASLSEERRRIYRDMIGSLHEYDTDVTAILDLLKTADDTKAKTLADGMALASRTSQMIEAARATNDPAVLEAAGDVEATVLATRTASLRFLATLEPEGPAAVTANASKAQAAIDLLDKGAPDLHAKIAPLHDTLASYAANFSAYAAVAGKPEAVYNQRSKPRMVAMQQQIDTVEASLKQDFAASVGATDSIVARTTLLQAVLAGIGLVVGAALAFVIGRGITLPLGRMTAAMTKLAEGDKTIDIPSRDATDEIGDMARAVEVFKQNAIAADRMAAEQESARAARERRATQLDTLVRDFESKVSGLVGQLSSGSTELEATARSMTGTADRTNQRASIVASASEEASTGLQTVATAAEELTASIHEISRQVAQSAKITGKAVSDAERTDGIVRALADGAEKIGQVVGLISDIAGQTNLLALNATIEAARAGDAGKGFAVVASEVKNLATQTSKATGDIASQINQIQAATKEAVDAIRDIATTITEVSTIAATIAAAVEEQGSATAEIARNVQQTAQAAQEVTTNIASVSEAANETGAAGNQVLSAAGELSRQAEELKGQVDVFVSGVRAA